MGYYIINEVKKLKHSKKQIDREISNYLLNSEIRDLNKTLKNIASDLNVSISQLERYSNKCGIEGFQMLKHAIIFYKSKDFNIKDVNHFSLDKNIIHKLNHVKQNFNICKTFAIYTHETEKTLVQELVHHLGIRGKNVDICTRQKELNYKEYDFIFIFYFDKITNVQLIENFKSTVNCKNILVITTILNLNKFQNKTNIIGLSGDKIDLYLENAMIIKYLTCN